MLIIIIIIMGGATRCNGKESTCQQKTWVRSLDQEDPLEKGMSTHCSIAAWTIPWTGAWRATVHGGHKELDTIELLTLLFSFTRSTQFIAGHVPKTDRYIVVFGTFTKSFNQLPTTTAGL